MLHRVWEEGDDIVLASCYLYGGGIRGTNLHRIALSHVANGLMKKALGLSGLATLSSFYRVYQVSALQAMHRRWGDALHLHAAASSAWSRSCTGRRSSGSASRRCRWCWTARAGRGAARCACCGRPLAYLRLAARGVSGRL